MWTDLHIHTYSLQTLLPQENGLCFLTTRYIHTHTHACTQIISFLFLMFISPLLCASAGLTGSCAGNSLFFSFFREHVSCFRSLLSSVCCECVFAVVCASVCLWIFRILDLYLTSENQCTHSRPSWHKHQRDRQLESKTMIQIHRERGKGKSFPLKPCLNVDYGIVSCWEKQPWLTVFIIPRHGKTCISESELLRSRIYCMFDIKKTGFERFFFLQYFLPFEDCYFSSWQVIYKNKMKCSPWHPGTDKT